MAPDWVVRVEPALPPEIPAVACVIRRVLVVSPLWRPTRDVLRDWLCRGVA